MAKSRKRQRKGATASRALPASASSPRPPAAAAAAPAAPASTAVSAAPPGLVWQAPVWYKWLLALLVASPPLLGVYGHKYGYSPDLHMASVIQVGATAMLVLFFLLPRPRASLNILTMPVLLPLWGFLGWACLSLLWGHNDYEGSIKLLDWSGALLTAFLITQTFNQPKDVDRCLYVLFASGVVLVTIGLLQYYADFDLIDQHYGPAITFNNKNMAAQYMLLIIPIGILMMFRVSAPHWKILFLSGSLAQIILLFYGTTRNAILCFGLQLALLAFFLGREMVKRWHDRGFWQRFVSYGCVGIVVLLLLSLLNKGDGNLIKYTIERFVTLWHHTVNYVDETRFPIWANTVEMIKEHLWFGVGIGNWMVEYPRYYRSAMVDWEMGLDIQHINAHNDYLELFAELGLVGMLLMLWGGVGAAWRGAKMAFKMDYDHRMVVVLLLVATAGLAMNAAGSFAFEQPAPICLFIVYISLIEVYWRRYQGAHLLVSLQRFGSRGQLAATSVAVLLFAGTTWHHQRWYQTEISFRKATIASRRSDVQGMLVEGLRAKELFPQRRRLRNFVAMGYMRRGNYDKAIEAFDDVLEAYPNMLHTLTNAITAYDQGGRAAEAMPLVRRLVEARDSQDSLYLAGVVSFHAGQYELAKEYLLRSYAPPKYGDRRLGQRERAIADALLQRLGTTPPQQR